VLPSEILQLETAWGAWQLNELTLIIGRRAEKNVNDGKDALDGFPANNGKSPFPVKGGYLSARQRVRKKVRIKANGIW